MVGGLYQLCRISGERLPHENYELTIDDPKIFMNPWRQEFEIVAKPEWDSQGLFEYVCEENNLQNIVSGVIKVWKIPEDPDQ